MGTASANNKDPNTTLRKALAEGTAGGVAPDNQFGTEGGGGGMGSASAEASLADFLPGGKKDPTKNRQIAGASKVDAHPEIVSPGVNLFSGVTKRMQLICTLKEFIGCN